MREFTHSLTIQAPPAAVLDAFFDPEALASWWHVTRSLCVPRPLGVYAVEWVPTEWKDDVLGRLGGAFRGTVIEFKAGREFFIADAYWLPPDGEPIGPMALEATCTLLGERTVLKVRQSGWESAPRWSRYYDLIATGFTLALDELKRYVESHWND
ncbi:MAG TPA: SRPBCC domain-containing protein [Vicinamibacterales bacterium]